MAFVPLVANPMGYNPFGPAKAFVLAVCATMVCVGVLFDADLIATLLSRLQTSRVAWAAGALWAVVALSTAASADLRQSIIGTYPEYQAVIAWGAASVIALGVASLPLDGVWRAAARGVSLAVVLMGAYSLLQALGADPVTVDAGSLAARVRATLGNSSNAGVYLSLALPILVERGRSEDSRAWRTVAGAGFVLAIGMIVFTLSRGAWLGLIAAVVVWFGCEATRMDANRRVRAVLTVVGIVVVLAAAVLVVPQLRERVAGPGNVRTVEWRLLVWHASERIVMDRPLLGWGPNSFRNTYPSYRPRALSVNRSLDRVAGDPHNILVSSAVSLGIPGLLALCALLAAAVVVCVRWLRRTSRDDLRPIAVASALAGGLTALMFHYLTLDTLPMLALLLGVLVSVEPLAYPQAAAAKWGKVALAVAACVFGIVSILAAGLLCADTVMGRAVASTSMGSDWTKISARLRVAQVLAPWEPSYQWAIGKWAIQAVESGTVTAYGDGQTALEAVRKQLPQDSGVVFDEAYLRLAYGIVTRDPGPIKQARVELVALTEADPNNPRYWGLLGLAAGSLGNFDEAKMALRTAIALDPSNGEYRKLLRQVEASEGR